jgi:hypothetical protein
MVPARAPRSAGALSRQDRSPVTKAGLAAGKLPFPAPAAFLSRRLGGRLGTALTGVLLIPLQPYIFHPLRALHRRWGWVASASLTMSTFGLIGVGAIPDNPATEALHDINAGLAFGGFYFGIFAGGIVLFRYGRLKIHQSLPFLICGLSGPAGFLISRALSISPFGLALIKLGIKGSYPWYLTFSTWEWMLFVSIFADLIIFLLILPDPEGSGAEAPPRRKG